MGDGRKNLRNSKAYLKSGRTKKSITDTTRRKIEIVKNFLNENFAEEISRDSLAEAVDMSSDHLGRTFKQYTGNKISDFLNRKRIEVACKELKETDQKIIDIAFGVGFESLRTFNKVFLDSVGVNPSSYRKQSSPPSTYSLEHSDYQK